MTEARWLKECEVCSSGLCQAMASTMEKQKISENSAAKVLARVVENQLGHPLYTAKQLLDRYRYHTGKDKKVSEIPKDKGKQREPQTKLVRDRKSQAPFKHPRGLNNQQLGNVLEQLRVAAEPYLNGTDYSPRLKLENAEKDFTRTRDNPPEGITEQQAIAWLQWFLLAEIRYLAEQLQQHYYKQLPEEVGEHRAKRGRRPKEKGGEA